MSHLLPLSALHAAAPGVLDVVFGPDGTFEGAPAFSPPLWTGIWSDRLEDPICQWGWCWGEVYMSEDGLALFDDHRQVEDAYLDCRIPSVAARLAGLCARALGATSGDGWMIHLYPKVDYPFGGYIGLRRHDSCITFNRDGILLRERGVSVPVAAMATKELFLASLTLALAPKIAALGGPRV